MPESNRQGVSYFYRLWQWLKNKMIQEVPEDYGWCEFDCEKLQCSMGDCQWVIGKIAKTVCAQKSKVRNNPEMGLM